MKRICLVLFTLLIILPVFCIVVYSQDQITPDSFDTIEVDETRQRTALASLDVQLLSDEIKGSTIACMAVHTDGHIALGLDEGKHKTVMVFRHDGTFQYGFQFVTAGTYGIVWNDEHIAIYLTRSDFLITLNKLGQCVSFREVQLTDSSNTAIRHILSCREVKIGQTSYKLSRDLGFGEDNYARLVIQTQDGQEQIIYDVTAAHTTKELAKLVFLIFLLSVFGSTWYKYAKTGKKA